MSSSDDNLIHLTFAALKSLMPLHLSSAAAHSVHTVPFKYIMIFFCLFFKYVAERGDFCAPAVRFSFDIKLTPLSPLFRQEFSGRLQKCRGEHFKIRVILTTGWLALIAGGNVCYVEC